MFSQNFIKYFSFIYSVLIFYLFINDYLVYTETFNLSIGSFLENYLYPMDVSKINYILILSFVFIIYLIVYFYILKIFYYSKNKNASIMFFQVVSYILLIFLIFTKLFNINTKKFLDVLRIIFIFIFPLNIYFNFYKKNEKKLKITEFFNIKEKIVFVLLNILLLLYLSLYEKSILKLLINFATLYMIFMVLVYFLYVIYIVSFEEIEQIKSNIIYKNVLILIIIIFSIFLSIYNYSNWKFFAQKRDFSFNLFLNTVFIKKTKPFNLEFNNSIILNGISPDCNIRKINSKSCYIPLSSNEKIFFQKSDDNESKICVVILQLKEMRYNFFKKFKFEDKNVLNSTSNYEILDIGYIEVKKNINLCKTEN